MSCDSVFDVKVVAHIVPVGANNWTLIAQDRANDAGNNPIPVQIAPAIKIPARATVERFKNHLALWSAVSTCPDRRFS